MEMSTLDPSKMGSGTAMALITTTAREKFTKESGNKIYGMEEGSTLSLQERLKSMGSGTEASSTGMQKSSIVMETDSSVSFAMG